MDEVRCPFCCEEKDDLYALKYHLQNGFCYIYNKTTEKNYNLELIKKLDEEIN